MAVFLQDTATLSNRIERSVAHASHFRMAVDVKVDIQEDSSSEDEEEAPDPAPVRRELGLHILTRLSNTQGP